MGSGGWPLLSLLTPALPWAGPVPLAWHLSLHQVLGGYSQMMFVCAFFCQDYTISIERFDNTWTCFLFIPWENLNVTRVPSSFVKTCLSRHLGFWERKNGGRWGLDCYVYHIPTLKRMVVISAFSGAYLYVCGVGHGVGLPSLNPTTINLHMLLSKTVFCYVLYLENLRGPTYPASTVPNINILYMAQTGAKMLLAKDHSLDSFYFYQRHPHFCPRIPPRIPHWNGGGIQLKEPKQGGSLVHWSVYS